MLEILNLSLVIQPLYTLREPGKTNGSRLPGGSGVSGNLQRALRNGYTHMSGFEMIGDVPLGGCILAKLFIDAAILPEIAQPSDLPNAVL